MSDTPRTDAAVLNPTEPEADVVLASFAEQLERELNKALAKVALLEEQLEFFIGDSE